MHNTVHVIMEDIHLQVHTVLFMHNTVHVVMEDVHVHVIMADVHVLYTHN